MAERCDGCGKRRMTAMDPGGLDLCSDCTVWAAERDRALRRVTLEEAADALWKVGSSEGELDAVGWLRDRAASADVPPGEGR